MKLVEYAPVLLNQKPQSERVVEVRDGVDGEEPTAVRLLTIFPEIIDGDSHGHVLSWSAMTTGSNKKQIAYKAAFLACQSLTPSPKSMSLWLLYSLPTSLMKVAMSLEWYSAWEH